MYTLCTYAIRLEKGAKVQLEFLNISFYHHSDHYFKVYDGRNSSAPLLVQLTANNRQKILASGNEVFIQYKVHWYDRYYRQWLGFRLQYFDNQGKTEKTILHTQICLLSGGVYHICNIN